MKTFNSIQIQKLDLFPRANTKGNACVVKGHLSRTYKKVHDRQQWPGDSTVHKSDMRHDQ